MAELTSATRPCYTTIRDSTSTRDSMRFPGLTALLSVSG
jgi:hypothetical protein